MKENKTTPEYRSTYSYIYRLITNGRGWGYQRPITPKWNFFLFGTRISMTSYACASADASRLSHYDANTSLVCPRRHCKTVLSRPAGYAKHVAVMEPCYLRNCRGGRCHNRRTDALQTAHLLPYRYCNSRLRALCCYQYGKLVTLKRGVMAINHAQKTAQITFARTLDRTRWLPLRITVA